MRILFDSRKLRYKEPFGCLRPGETCRLRVEVPLITTVSGLSLRVETDEGFTALAAPLCQTGTEGDYAVFETVFSLSEPGLYFYWFRFATPGSDFSLFRYGAGDTNMEAGERWQLSCVPASAGPPDWCRGAVIYQIFPDRFFKAGEPDLTDKLGPYTIHADSADVPEFRPNAKGIVTNSDFFGGNFRGIEKKLPYLRQLQVRTLYLNPVCMAYSNHRYDTADYLRPDPMLGTPEDFQSLCAAAHRLSMHIILDGVFSHTGSDSVYFDALRRFGGGAATDPDSPYRKWYRFSRWPDEYEAWWGIRTLPAVSELEPSYLEFILQRVLPYWLGLGADGFRLDVADELPDAFILALRQRVRELKPDALVLGEVWEDASNKISYGQRRRYFTAGELDAVMNYPYRTAILDLISGRSTAQAFGDAVLALAENYPKAVLDASMLSLSTHDTARVLTVLGDGFQGPKEKKAGRRMPVKARERALRAQRAAACLQFCLPGSPCVYYGEEAGMEGFEDPFNRGFFPWGREDQALTDFYRRLAAAKLQNPALRRGDIAFSDAGGELLLFTRRADDDAVTVAVNRGNAEARAAIDGEVLLLEGGELRDGAVILRPFGCAVWKNTM
jgi:cyclomaltodextrinase